MRGSIARTRSGDMPDLSRRRGVATSDNSRQTRMIAYVIGCLVLYVVLTTIYQSHFAGMFVPDIETDEEGRTRIRRRPHRHKTKLDPSKPTTEYDAVLEGYLTMIDINIPPLALQGTDAYRGVTAKFCHLDWKLQQKAPQKVPMFNDLIRQSSLCDSTLITVDLWDLAKQARAYDDELTASQQILAVAPTGVIFHESRCGSTLTANALAGFSPEHSRVYSESSVQLHALMACDTNPCNPELHSMLLHDIFYLAGRTVRKERPQYVFYKISSIGTMYMDKFTEAFPTTPWMYLYRDTVEVMQSHLAPSTVGGLTRSRDRPVCLRLQSQSRQPATTVQIAQSKQKDPMELTREEYCATHLAALSLSALQEHDRTQKGRFVNYNQLPDILWTDLLPNFFRVAIDATMIQRIQSISEAYSKDKGQKGIKFQEDGETKRQSASPEVVAAAGTFAADVYQKLEKLSGKTGGEGQRRQ